MRHVAILTDTPGWHGVRLRRAFRARGVEAKYVSLAQCRFDLAGGGLGMHIPGFERRLPEAAFVRAIPAGTFEQVTLRLSVLHALREAGVPVYNDARAIEKSVDKAMTSFLLARHGIATPPTWVTESTVQARKILLAETGRGHDLIVKPLFGSQGEGLVRLTAGDALPDGASFNHVYYLQRYVGAAEGDWHDWRVFVVGGRALAAMVRRGRSWISNFAQGASCETSLIEPEFARLAVAATTAVGADYAGVDIIRDRRGRAYVLEVNSIPAWKGLQSVANVDIAAALVDDLVTRRMPTAMQVARC